MVGVAQEVEDGKDGEDGAEGSASTTEFTGAGRGFGFYCDPLAKRGAGASAFFCLNNREALDDFVSDTGPAQCGSWDVLILDQHLEMRDGTPMVLGTNLLPGLRSAGLRDCCIIMHSGNTAEEDISLYRAHGTHGALGKGAKDFCKRVVGMFGEFVAGERT